MDRTKKIPGNIALLLGISSILLVIRPFIGLQQFLGGIRDVTISLLFGVRGLVLSKIQSKIFMDRVTKTALWCGLVGTILATIKGIVIVVK